MYFVTFLRRRGSLCPHPIILSKQPRVFMKKRAGCTKPARLSFGLRTSSCSGHIRRGCLPFFRAFQWLSQLFNSSSWPCNSPSWPFSSSSLPCISSSWPLPFNSPSWPFSSSSRPLPYSSSSWPFSSSSLPFNSPAAGRTGIRFGVLYY